MAGRINDPKGSRRDGLSAEEMDATIALSGDASCIAQARRHTAAFLAGHQRGHRPGVPERVLGLAELVVSELVTNACKYAQGPIRLRLRLAGDMLEVEVRDSNPVLPAPSAADPARVGRHGLEIVQAVAADLRVLREEAGKCITARILLSPT